MNVITLNPPIASGQRVFTCGHSFHVWAADLLPDLAREAGIPGHIAVGTSPIGGSRAIQHWDVPMERNIARQALRAGIVDVLTLSCMTFPDAGIRHFAEWAAAHNPAVRLIVQELWLPEDRFPFDALNRVRKSVDEFNGATVEGLRNAHEGYFDLMETYVRGLNADLGRPVVWIQPDAEATLALRERIIAGTAPGLEKQSDLFSDPWGHPTPPLKALAAYCHFSVIYRRSPVGLPVPRPLADYPGWNGELIRLLQELAWTAASQHPMSGVARLAPV
jgi:hypothetical protein